MRNKRRKRTVPEIDMVRAPHPSDYDMIGNSPVMKQYVFSNLLMGVMNAMDNNSDCAEIVRISNTEQNLSLNKKQWRKSLEAGMNFFAAQEDYEESIKFRNIIEKL